ncbi:hypothetical protein PGB90_008923 [Kerria lacca]
MQTDGDRELCNDLGGESSEEDNEKQNKHSPPEYIINSHDINGDSTEDIAIEEENVSEREEDTTKFGCNPVLLPNVQVDGNNYLYVNSQSGASTKQSSISSSTISSNISSPTLINPLSPQPFQFCNAHREFFILENRVRPRSSSLTDNIEFFRTRRNMVTNVSLNRSNEDLSSVKATLGMKKISNLSIDMFTVTESVNSAKPIIPQVELAHTPLSCITKNICDFHRQKLFENISVPDSISSAALATVVHENGFNVSMPVGSYNCARTVSFHALLCSCKLTCCCMCDFFYPSDCHACLNGVCSQFVLNYPCVKSNILAPIKNFCIDKVSIVIH